MDVCDIGFPQALPVMVNQVGQSRKRKGAEKTARCVLFFVLVICLWIW